MARQRLSEDLVIACAGRLADASGFGAVTLSSVAAELGVATSALYNHCAGLDGLHHQLAVAATNELAQMLRTAAIGTGGDRALAAMAAAYRGFALEHPGRFAATLRPPAVDDPRLHEANRSIIDTFALVYAAMGFDPQACEQAAQSTRSALHGFLALEHTSGQRATPSDGDDQESDENFDHLVSMLQRALLDR